MSGEFVSLSFVDLSIYRILDLMYRGIQDMIQISAVKKKETYALYISAAFLKILLYLEFHIFHIY